MESATRVLLRSGAVALGAALPRLRSRLELSQAKHPSLSGHARIARRLAPLVPFYEYDDERFFRSDDASAETAVRRRGGLPPARAALPRALPEDASRSTAEAEPGISDLQFANAYRVPFQFRRYVREHLGAGAFVASSSGVTVTDLDGNGCYDLDRLVRRQRLRLRLLQGVHRPRLRPRARTRPGARRLPPGGRATTSRRLQAISGLDEVSFHMSGTEAVMQAVRLARYHTGRTHLVRFCGAYHGWWDDVQPGVGNPTPAHDIYTLADMHDAHAARAAHARRHRVRAGQPVAGAASERQRAGRFDAGRQRPRRAFDRARLHARGCSSCATSARERGIVLIFDEVFVGFRLAPGGAQEYFGVAADLVTYGKTLGGGLPIGVLCGRRDLMQRFRDDQPANICFARGTFNSHPYVMAAMNEFLHAHRHAARSARSTPISTRSGTVAPTQLNRRLRDAGAAGAGRQPVTRSGRRCYTQPSRYNWMLQFYLRAEGLELSWIGTGRLILSLDYTDAGFRRGGRALRRRGACDAARRLVVARDAPATNASIRRRILREMLARTLLTVAGARRRRRQTRAPSGGPGIEQLAAQQVQRRLPVQHDVVERVGEDLEQPHEAGLHVLQEEQVHRAEQQRADADRDPATSATWRTKAGEVRVRLEQAEAASGRSASTIGETAQIASRIALRRRL